MTRSTPAASSRRSGGVSRNYLAALDCNTGEVLDWNPNPSLNVHALARSGNTIFVGGQFDFIGGERHRRIAAVDASSGAVDQWDPDPDGYVLSLATAGSTIFVGGAFSHIGGQPRQCLAAVDITSGLPTAWNPGVAPWGTPPSIKALALHDSILFVGGTFSSIGGQPRICLAAVDTATGLATDWDPGADGYVWSLLRDGNTIYAGGGFNRAGQLPLSSLAGFSIPSPPPLAPLSFSLAQSVPNPARDKATIRFTLPEPSPVTLSVYDLQGRRIADLLDRAQHSAGVHEVPVRTDHWKPGVYFYRLEAGGRSTTRRLVVLD